jgi:branched-chain amino acid transport system ATP-binding protein
MLTLDKLNFSYGDMQVLWDIDLQVNEGEIVTVVGANGAGKSTTLKNISRLVKPASGSIIFDGVDMQGLESHQVVERGIVQAQNLSRDDRPGKSAHGIVHRRSPQGP